MWQVRDVAALAFAAWCGLLALIVLLPTACAVAYLAWAQNARMKRASRFPAPDAWPGRHHAFVGHLKFLSDEYRGDLSAALHHRELSTAPSRGGRAPAVLVRLLATPALAIREPLAGRRALERASAWTYQSELRYRAAGMDARREDLTRGTSNAGLCRALRDQAEVVARELLRPDPRDLYDECRDAAARAFASAFRWLSRPDALVRAAQELHDAAVGASPLALPPKVAAALVRARGAAQAARSVRDRDGDAAAWRVAHGLEPTALALFWCLHDLAAHPTVMGRLLGEVDAYPERARADETEPDLRRLRFVHGFVREVLRVHAPVPLATREANADTPLEEHGGNVASPGALLLVPIHSYHHSVSHWVRPHEFSPERFEPQQQQAAASEPWENAYMPFGTACPFAKESPKALVAFLVALLKRVRPRGIDASKQQAAVRGVGLTLPADAGFKLRWESRT